MTSDAQAVPKRRTVLRDYEAVVLEVVRETPDTVTLVLFTGNEPLEYLAGQFASIDPKQFPALSAQIAYFEQVKGKKELIRAYSMSSAPHEKYLAITIKQDPFEAGVQKYPPILSPYLVHAVERGMRMRIRGFTGPYVLPPDVEAQATHIVHVVAGSGAVPNFSMLKDALHRGLAVRHTFIDSNKTLEDICFRRELDALEARHPEKLKVIHLLTRERADFPHDARIRRGRVTQQLLAEVVTDPATTLAYICGPAISTHERRAALEAGVQATPRFLETAIGFLQELGLDNKRIKRESYG